MSLFTKYPELEPMTMFFDASKGSYEQHELMPEGISADVLFIFGIFPLSNDFEKFMKAHPQIEVVFLVETLAELLFFVKSKLDEGFDSDRIHVKWHDGQKEELEWVEEIVSDHPYEKMAFFQNGLDEEKFNHLKKTFLRKAVLESSVHQELMHYPRLCKNLFSNVFKISKAFDVGQWKDQFKSVPAVITGAGPTLKTVQNELKELEDKALIFAGGTTISSLTQMGINPHMAFAMDPNFEEYDRLRLSHCFTAPLIYGNRVQKDIFRFFGGDVGYIRTDTGGLFETFVDDRLGIKDHGILKNLSDEALSVTTIALMTAIYLGCDPIYFAGVDLSFKKNARYSGNILSSWESQLKKDEAQETKWMMEKDVIDDVVLSYPERRFFDATGDGLTFKKIPVKRLDLEHFKIQRSLKGRIDDLIIDSRFDISTSKVSSCIKEIKESLSEMSLMIQKFLDEEMVYNIFAFEIEENLAFKIFFKGMLYAMQASLGKKVKDDALKIHFSKILKEAQNLSSLI
ncbi:MAG: hypothetical protein S4CHLAM20_03670 [Chlamydiia bacterium]|nr:hypothetical protein [Chlamydiia bacterium]